MNMNIQTDIRKYEYEYEYSSHTGHMTCDMWHMTHDIWYVTHCGGTSVPVSSNLSMGISAMLREQSLTLILEFELG